MKVVLMSKNYRRNTRLIIFVIIFIASTFPSKSTPTLPRISKYSQAIKLAGNKKHIEAIEILQQQIKDDSSFTPAYLRLAEFYRYANKLNDGQTYFQNAIDQFPENPNFYLGLALIAKWSNDWKGTFDNTTLSLTKHSISPEALALLVESALKLNLTNQLPKIFRKLKRIESASHLNDLGYAIWRYRINKFKKAKATLLQYLKKNQEDWFGHYYLGKVSHKLKEEDAVFSSLRKAIQLIGQGDPYQKLKVLQSLGSIYQEKGELDRSEDYLYQALRLAQSIGALTEQIEIQLARSIIFMKEGFYQKMADVCLNGIEIAQEINEMFTLSNLHYNLAYAYGKMGDMDKAVNYYLLTIEQATRVKDSELLSQAYAGIAQAYLKLSDLEKAFEFLNKSLKVAQKAKLRDLEQDALLSIAEVHKEQGDIKSAKQTYEKVLKYAQRAQKYKLAEICFLKLASLYLKPNSNLKNAKYYLSLADAFARQTLQLHFAANHRWMQGKIALLEGDVESAETLFLDAIQLGKETGSYVSVLAGHAGLINTYVEARYPDLAAEQGDTALKCLDEFDNLCDREISSEFFDLSKDLFFPVVHAFLEFGDPYRAYEICEQYKAQIHWNNISSIKFKIKSSIPDSLIWKHNKINTRISDHWSELRESWRKDARDNLDTLMTIKHEIQQLHAQKKAALLELAENYPRYFNLAYPEGESLSNLQDALRPMNGSFLHYLTGEEATIIIIVRPDTIHSKLVNVGSKFLTVLVEQISPLFTPSNSGFMESAESGEPLFRLDVAGRLYQLIFEPIKDLIPTQSPLIISPDNVLNRFPFECLVTNLNELRDEFDYALAHFLVEKYTVSYVPYAKMLNWPTFRKRRSKKPLVAFVNSSFYLAGAEPHRNSQNNNDSTGETNDNSRLTTSTLSDYESAQISQIFGKRKAKIYSGPNATKARFLQESPKYLNIHLALPGLLDDRQSLYSTLYFSNQSGLKTYELFNLKLNADLVTLSDLRREPRALNMGESLSGLVQGFIYSGVPSVVTNLWKTRQKESLVLLDNFYFNLRLGMTKGEALQHAKVQYLNTGNRNPYYWASLVLHGNPAPMNTNTQVMNNLFLLTIFGLIILVGLAVWQIIKIKNEKRS
ncbi:MAG: CHAT domain-containing protein [bacterium]